jgi:hypothetical protein
MRGVGCDMSAYKRATIKIQAIAALLLFGSVLEVSASHYGQRWWFNGICAMALLISAFLTATDQWTGWAVAQLTLGLVWGFIALVAFSDSLQLVSAIVYILGVGIWISVLLDRPRVKRRTRP